MRRAKILLCYLAFFLGALGNLSWAEAPSVCESLSQQAAYLQQLDTAYFAGNASPISDTAYDTLVEIYRTTRQQHPECGAAGNSTGKRPTPPIAEVKPPAALGTFPPMGSLVKVYTADALKTWLTQVETTLAAPVIWMVEPKLDGQAVSLTYTHGVLTAAETRGNQGAGKDVLATARHLRGIPEKLPTTQGFAETVVVRGEALLTLSDFQAAKARQPELSTPRNAAAGALMAKDNGERVRQRGVAFYAYQAFGIGNHTHQATLNTLNQLGFVTVPTSQQCSTTACVLDAVNHLQATHPSLPYPTDGVVVKVNDLAQQAQLGWGNQAPKWAMAYKFTNPTATTKLTGVDWTLGRTGRLTPVALLQPVTINGTTITRATLHNAAHVAGLGLHTGDTVVVEKAGQVIPQVVAVVAEKRVTGAQPITPPTGEALREQQQVAALLHWAKTMGIRDLGRSTLQQWVAAGQVAWPADLYRLTPEKTDTTETTKAILGSIQASKSRPWPTVLRALGLPGVGAVQAAALGSHFPTMAQLQAASVAALSQTPGIGKVRAKKLKEALNASECQALLLDLQRVGLTAVQPTTKVGL